MVHGEDFTFLDEQMIRVFAAVVVAHMLSTAAYQHTLEMGRSTID